MVPAKDLFHCVEQPRPDETPRNKAGVGASRRGACADTSVHMCSRCCSRAGSQVQPPLGAQTLSRKGLPAWRLPGGPPRGVRHALPINPALTLPCPGGLPVPHGRATPAPADALPGHWRRPWRRTRRHQPLARWAPVTLPARPCAPSGVCLAPRVSQGMRSVGRRD